MIKIKHLLLIGTVLQVALGYSQVKPFQKLKSPDGQIVIQFGLDDQQALVYNLSFKNKIVVNWSALGLESETVRLAQPVTITGKEENNYDETFSWPLGENALIRNNYHEVLIHCQASGTKFDIAARAYNGSLAFKYSLKHLAQPIRLKRELTEFNLASESKIYQYHEESIFRPMSADSLPGTSDLPSTLISKDRLYISIGEAGNRDYTKCVLIRGARPHSLALQFYTDTLYRNHVVSAVRKDSVIMFRDSLVTPWRTISCAESAIGLHDFSELNLKLVAPLNTEIPAGIKPGKVFRVPISTEGAVEGADFALKNNFQYIMLDAGWYGAEFRTVSDPAKPIPGLNLPEILAHARSRGIGVILYVNYVGLRLKLDSILPLYKSWGVSGIKFGFVDGGTQNGLRWLDSAMQKVNDYGFILNVHDHYKPTGLSRRYPYNLSQEGIRGDENSPDAFHTTVLPYTRYLAGPADFTFCYPNSRDNFAKNLKVSKGQQLALTVIYFDPLQAIYWYGKAKDYTDDKETEFFKYVPTVWDETHYLAGEIGQSISVARKKDEVWYVGCASGLMPWKTTLKLDFLDKGKKYSATVYEDDGNKGIRIKTLSFKRGDKLPVNLEAKSGQAMIFRLENK